MEYIREKINSNPTLKWIMGLFGVIVLGAVGSGVWQLIGEPLINFTINTTIDLMDLLVKNYKDSLYIKASKGFHESSSTQIYMLVLALPPFMGLMFIFRERSGKKAAERIDKELDEIVENEDSSVNDGIAFLQSSTQASKERLKKLERMLFISLLAFAVISLNSAIQVSYINRTTTYVEVTLDRLSPYVSDEKIKQLRAQFREVDGSEDYYQLYHDLELELSNNNLDSKSVQPL